MSCYLRSPHEPEIFPHDSHVARYRSLSCLSFRRRFQALNLLVRGGGLNREHHILIMKRPTVLYPTLVKGIIYGPIRCESLDGSEMYLEGSNTSPTYFDHFAPFEMKGKTWAVSHLQKKSPRFTLLFDPFIFHWGKFWKLQEDGKPGTERGIYWRTPGWRRDLDPKLEIPWVWSWGFLGGHLD